MDAQGNPQDITPLHLRHRPNTTITRWVQETVPVVLSYKAQNYQAQYKDKTGYFSPAGAKAYLAFLKEADFLKTLKTGRYDISGFVRDYPVILNEGPVAGRYRWVYKMNIMVTYMPGGAKNYTDIKDGGAVSKKFTVTAQIGRSKAARGDHGIVIETWDVKAKK